MAEEETVVRELERAKLECLDARAVIGHMCRANSVNPFYDGIRDLPDKIPICEETFLS